MGNANISNKKSRQQSVLNEFKHVFNFKGLEICHMLDNWEYSEIMHLLETAVDNDEDSGKTEFPDFL